MDSGPHFDFSAFEPNFQKWALSDFARLDREEHGVFSVFHQISPYKAQQSSTCHGLAYLKHLRADSEEHPK